MLLTGIWPSGHRNPIRDWGAVRLGFRSLGGVVSPAYLLPSVLPPTAASALSQHRLSALALVVHLPEAKRQAADDGGGVGVGWGWGILPRPRDAAPCSLSSRRRPLPPIATAPGHALKPPQGLLAPGRVCRSASAFHVSLTYLVSAGSIFEKGAR